MNILNSVVRKREGRYLTPVGTAHIRKLDDKPGVHWIDPDRELSDGPFPSIDHAYDTYVQTFSKPD